MLAKQNGVCAICGKRPEDDRLGHGLAVDHDHVTGVNRGLLCRDCNIGIGKLGDSISGLMRAVRYLETRSDQGTEKCSQEPSK
jgi:hypothetical protein